MMEDFYIKVYTFLVEGNLCFVGTLSTLFLAILSISVVTVRHGFRSDSTHTDKIKKLIRFIRSLALFQLVAPILARGI